MKKTILLLCVFLITSLFAQTQEWGWAGQAGGTADDQSKNLAVDSEGNVYVTGYFNGVAAFGSFILTSMGYSDVFLTKQDADGNYLWAVRAGGTGFDNGMAVAVDTQGNIHLSGSFQSTATFGTTEFTSSGGYDTFISLLDPNGNFLWTRRAGGSSDDQCFHIAVDANRNSYICGRFGGTATFGTQSITSSGAMDAFITKLDEAGNFLWTRRAGGIGEDCANAIATNAVGHTIITGYFNNSMMINAMNLVSSGSSDVFVARLDAGGNFLWGRQAGGIGTDTGTDVAIDEYDNYYVTGSYMNTASFGTISLPSVGSNDVFIAKLDDYSNYLWAQRGGGVSADYGTCIALDTERNVYVSGYFFGGPVTFGTTTLTNTGINNTFVTKLNTSGSFLWAKQAGGTTYTRPNGIAVNGTGTSYLTGYFAATTYFGTTTLIASGSNDVFVARLRELPYLTLNPADGLAFGSVYTGATSTQQIWLRNKGGLPLLVTSLGFYQQESAFAVAGVSLPQTILPGDSLAVSISFAPLTPGTVLDSLILGNNSSNLPRAVVSLSGNGVQAPPLPPEGVQAVMQGADAVISWQAVTETIAHTPIVPDFYLIWFNGSSDPNGQYYFLGLSPTLTYTHMYVGTYSPHMFYRIQAFKSYARGGDIRNLGLVRGMTQDEVFRILGE